MVSRLWLLAAIHSVVDWHYLTLLSSDQCVRHLEALWVWQIYDLDIAPLCIGLDLPIMRVLDNQCMIVSPVQSCEHEMLVI